MITAWVFFYDPAGQGKYKLEERNGSSFTDLDPVAWGLPKDCLILLVLQKAQFLGAWILGQPVKKY